MAGCNARKRSLWVWLLLLPSLLHQAPAAATTLEKLLIMPGPVIEAHADVEGECRRCHAPLSDRQQSELCTTCHTEVGRDAELAQGYHGRLPAGQQGQCASCHTDHKGRDWNIVGLDEAKFDHAMTDFALLGAHTNVPCATCHAPGALHRQAESSCIGCHRPDDAHEGRLGEVCADCHTQADWRQVRFDHATTGFALTGGHMNVMCATCHRSKDFTAVERSCIGCHRADDVHRGRNGPECADCHQTSNWPNATFNHLLMTGFRLDGGHRGLGCRSCHAAADFMDLKDGECAGCHRDDDVHKGRNGEACASCHTTQTWSAVTFDHAEQTGFALPAGHGGLACEACHTKAVHEPLPGDCGGCHADDDVHSGQLGTACEACHAATSWTAQLRFDHDLTSFPLAGKHAELACDACHASAAFHDTDGDCAACHREEDPHGGSLGAQCGLCHNPAAWPAWIFDHDAQTDFVLSGAHAGLACGACHSRPAGEEARAAEDCKTCHSRDDAHLGRFGNDCGRCHTTSSFKDRGR